MAAKINNKAAFECKQDVIVAAVNSYMKMKTHKYGIEVPTLINDVIYISMMRTRIHPDRTP